MTRRLVLTLSLALAACSGSGSAQQGSTASSTTSTSASSGTTGVIAGPTGPSTSSGTTSTSASSATSGAGTSGTSSSSGTASTGTSTSTATSASTSTTGSTGSTGTSSTGTSSTGTSASSSSSTTGPGSTASSSTASSSSSSSSAGSSSTGSTGGTTGTALQVVSVTSSQGAGPIDDNVIFTVTFNEPVDPASLSVNSSGGACTGSLQVSGDNFSTCLALTAPSVGSGGDSVSFGPNAPLPSGTSFLVRITSAVRSAGHVALIGEYTTGTFFTRLGDVTALQPTSQLQSITLWWQAPSSSRLQNVQVSWAEHGSANFTNPIGVPPGSPQTVTAQGLLPFTSYDFHVVAIDTDGQPSSGVTLTASTLFSGSTADWLPSQQVAGLAGHTFYAAWTASDLVVGLSAPDADGGVAPHPLSTGDALWLAVDTDPAGDATGEVRTTTQGSNDVIWPFRANYVVELKVTGTGATVTNLRDGVAQSWSAATFDSYEGAVTELRVPRAALFSPASARLALLAVNTGNGFAFDLAPANPGATDTLAYFASLTASLDPGSDLWDPSKSVSGSLLAQAPGLLRVQVAGAPGAGAVKVRGSLHPLSYALGDSDYRLTDAGSGSLAGAFNLGGSTGELFFQLDQADAGEPSFGAGIDRVFTLDGGAQDLPTLTFGQAYSASHPFQLTFRCLTGGSPSEVRGNVSELGSFSSAGAPVTYDGTSASATVGLSSHDFTQTPLQFKLYYANQSYEGGSDHTMNDDVINSRVLDWSAGTNKDF